MGVSNKQKTTRHFIPLVEALCIPCASRWFSLSESRRLGLIAQGTQSFDAKGSGIEDQ